MNALTPPEEELEVETLLQNARQIALDFARVNRRDEGDSIFEIETRVAALASQVSGQAAYDYLSALAMSNAHKQGLGNAR